MSASRIALASAVVALVAWALKALAIGVAGGLGESAAEAPLFLVGFVAVLTGSAALGAAVAFGRPVWMKVLAGIAGVATLLLVAGIGGSLVTVVQPDDPGWVWGEVNLWVAGIALLAATLWWRRATPGRPVA